MSAEDEADKLVAQHYCKAKGVRYLSHERYVSGWGDKKRDQLHIAVEDYTGRYETIISYDNAVEIGKAI